MRLSIYCCDEIGPVIRVQALSTDLTSTDPAYHNCVCNVMGAFLKGVD